MPSNVSIEFGIAQRKYDQAKTPFEKLEALQVMKTHAPKHKGGEHLRAEINKKIADLKRDIEKTKETTKKKGSSSSTLTVKKEGVGQIVLIGAPNSGKTFALNALTGTAYEVANYEFTTTTPQVGMMNFQNAKIQLVELPALTKGSSQGKASGLQILSCIRAADAIAVMLNDEHAVQEFEMIAQELKAAKIILNEQKPLIQISPSKFPGLSITGKEFLQMSIKDAEEFFKSMGLKNSNVILKETATIPKIMQVLDDSIQYKRCLIILTQGSKSFSELKRKFSGEVFVYLDQNLDLLKEKLFLLLNKMIIYTKRPGGKADTNQPMVLKKDSTVGELAEILHKDFANNLKYAKVWGSTKFPGQTVHRSYVLQNGDVVELQI